MGECETNLCFISKVQLSAELRYFAFVDSEGRFIDERKKQFPIQLLTDPHQAQPIFQLDKLIKNETFTLGINPEQKFYNTLKLELHNIHELDDNCTLQINIELFT